MQEIYLNKSIEDIPEEEWIDIKGYEGLYQVSNMGRVKSLERKYFSVRYNCEKVWKAKIIGYKQPNGYVCVELFKNEKSKYFRVHRLVAEAFIPNPLNKTTVDHINTIRHDNRVSNLRWFTQEEQLTENEITKERMKKTSAKNGRKIGKENIVKAYNACKKKVLCVTTGKVFNSASEAADFYNIKNKTAVSNAATPNNSHKSAGKLPDGTKLEWRYIDE